MSRWFRFYDDALNDPKVQKLPGDLFKFWVNLLCVASKFDGKLPEDELAFLMRMDPKRINENINELKLLGFIDGAEEITPHNWDKRQFKSDSADPTNAERQARYRERHNGKSNAVTAVTVTPTRTDTEQSRTEKTHVAAGAAESAFDSFKSKYPKRDGSYSWPEAKKLFFAKLKAGATVDEILQGASAYASRESKNIGTSYIMQPTKFLRREVWREFGEEFSRPEAAVAAKSLMPDTPEFKKLFELVPVKSFHHSQMVRAMDTRQPYYPPPDLLTSIGGG